MRNHLADKVCIDVVVAAGEAHFVKHSPADFVESPSVKAKVALAVFAFFAFAKHFLHLFDSG